MLVIKHVIIYAIINVLAIFWAGALWVASSFWINDEAGEEMTGLVEKLGSDQKVMFLTLPYQITTIRQHVGQNEADLTCIHPIQSGK